MFRWRKGEMGGMVPEEKSQLDLETRMREMSVLSDEVENEKVGKC